MSTTLIYRHHHQLPTNLPGNRVVAGLLEEWVDIHRQARTGQLVRRWSRHEPALRGFTSPGEVVDTIDAADFDRSDELLAGLLRLHQAGHYLAGRTLLQALLPGLVGRRWASEDQVGSVVAEFWQHAAEARPKWRIAANLIRTTLGLTAGTRFRPKVETLATDPAEMAALIEGKMVATTDQPALHEDLDELLRWAVDNGSITELEAETLAELYPPFPKVRNLTGAERTKACRIRAKITAQLPANASA